jgi:Regulator of ribonuclease activity B
MQECQQQATQFEPGDQEQGDLLLLAALRRDGVDLSAPVDVACFLELPELDGARAAARELRVAGWRVGVHVGDDGLAWLVRAERELVPSWHNVAAMGDTMHRVARRHGGAYDGWGAGPR